MKKMTKRPNAVGKFRKARQQIMGRAIDGFYYSQLTAFEQKVCDKLLQENRLAAFRIDNDWIVNKVDHTNSRF